MRNYKTELQMINQKCYSQNQILNGHGDYLLSIKGYSSNTVKSYTIDLEQFFRFISIRKNIVSIETEFDEIDISPIDVHLLKSIDLPDIYAYLTFATIDRQNTDNTRKRKTAAIRSLYHYVILVLRVDMKNPTQNLEIPKVKRRDPVYLTLDEALSLLNAVSGRNKVRDLAIITLFLNCGLRLSELTNIKLKDIQDETIHIIGKGNKERNIILNDACIDSLNAYLDVRPKDTDCDYLFLSSRKKQISNRMVQKMVEKNLLRAGLDCEKYSVHKLRHTAATLMHKYGKIDIRTLQKVLGHENISTTEIYTHIEDDEIRDAVYKNPLAKYKIEK